MNDVRLFPRSLPRFSLRVSPPRRPPADQLSPSQCRGFFIVFDVSDRSSFDAVKSIHASIVEARKGLRLRPSVVLVSTKGDLPSSSRKVPSSSPSSPPLKLTSPRSPTMRSERSPPRSTSSTLRRRPRRARVSRTRSSPSTTTSRTRRSAPRSAASARLSARRASSRATARRSLSRSSRAFVLLLPDCQPF